VARGRAATTAGPDHPPPSHFRKPCRPRLPNPANPSLTAARKH
jgi:hypothetical protein